jgi:hypothetical protein
MKANFKSLAALALVTVSSIFAHAVDRNPYPYIVYVDEGQNVKRCQKEIELFQDAQITESFPKNGVFYVTTTKETISEIKMLECVGGAEAQQFPAHW